MEPRLNYTGSFSNLPKYAIFTSSTWMKNITIPEKGWSGENVDVVINDSGIDALHFEFQDANGNSRVQLVDWNYLLANGDRLIASGSDGYNEWRSKDFNFAQINSYVQYLIASQSADPDYGIIDYITNQAFTIPNSGPNSGSSFRKDVTNTFDRAYPLLSDIALRTNADDNVTGYSSSMINYFPDNRIGFGADHGTHVAGTAVGRTKGWAHGANIFAITQPFGPSYFRPNNGSTQEAIYLFQLLKKAAGIDNPTIVNCSWGVPRYGVGASDWETSYLISNFDKAWNRIEQASNHFLTSSNPIVDHELYETMFTLQTKFYKSGIDNQFKLIQYRDWEIFTGPILGSDISFELYNHLQLKNKFTSKFGFGAWGNQISYAGGYDQIYHASTFYNNYTFISSSGAWTGDALMGMHPSQKFWTEWYEATIPDELFQRKAVDENVIFVFSAGNAHGIMNTIESVVSQSSFIHTASWFNPDTHWDGNAYESSARSIAYPTSNPLTQSWLEPGCYSYTKTWDKFRTTDSGIEIRVQNEAAKVGWLRRGDLPGRNLYDSRVICVGATDLYPHEDPYGTFAWNTRTEMTRSRQEWLDNPRLYPRHVEVSTGNLFEGNKEIIKTGSIYIAFAMDQIALSASYYINYTMEQTSEKWPLHGNVPPTSSYIDQSTWPINQSMYIPANNKSLLSDKTMVNSVIGGLESGLEVPQPTEDGPVDFWGGTAKYIQNQYTVWSRSADIPLDGVTNELLKDSYDVTDPTLPATEQLVFDHKSYFSERGPRIDIWAPGSYINSSTSYNIWSPYTIDTMYDETKRDFPKQKYFKGLFAFGMPDSLTGSNSYGPDEEIRYWRVSDKYEIIKAAASNEVYFDSASVTYHNYVQKNGTSMASPNVTGVLALYAQKNRNINSRLAKEWLQSTAYKGYIPDTDGCTPFGSGSSKHKSRFGDTRAFHSGFVNNIYGVRPQCGKDTTRLTVQETAFRPSSEGPMTAPSRSNGQPFTYTSSEAAATESFNNEVTQVFQGEYVTDQLTHRFNINRQYENANVMSLAGAKNLILHWPYSNITPDEVELPKSGSSLLSNISITGSVGLSNRLEEKRPEIPLDRSLISQIRAGIDPPIEQSASISQCTVTVVATSDGNKWALDGEITASKRLQGTTIYQFDTSDSSNNGHIFALASDTNEATSSYTTGVEVNGTYGESGSYVRLNVDNNTPNILYYYCTLHSGMGQSGSLIITQNNDYR